MACGGWEEPLMSVAKMVAAENRVHLDSKELGIVRPKGDVFPLRKVGNVFVIHLWVRTEANSRRLGFTSRLVSRSLRHRCEGQTIRPVRSEGVDRGRKVVEFDLGGAEDGQEE